MKARASDGIPRGSFFSFSKTLLRAIVPRAVLALVNITQATKHPRAPVTVRGLIIEMQRLGLFKPITRDCLLVAPSPGKFLEKHSEAPAKGACSIAFHSASPLGWWQRGCAGDADQSGAGIKYMAKSGRGRSQTWKTFLHNHAAGIGAVDFLIVPTVDFRLLFVLVILRHERRRLLSLNVTANPTAEWIAHQITDAFPWNEAPDYLIRDRDASYGHAVTKRLAAMGIRDHPMAARSPWQNGYAERLIGSIRRECLDHAVVFGEAHLRRIPAAYASYYNAFRTHLSLGKDSPAHRPIQQLGQLAARPILSGLHHHYYRI